VIVGPGGLDFEALLGRLHPAASRVARLRMAMPASFIAFDALAVRGADLRARPFRERRAAPERLLAGARAPLHVTPATEDVGVTSSFPDAAHRRLFDELRPLAIRSPPTPWRHGFTMSPAPLGRLRGAAGRWSGGRPLPRWTGRRYGPRRAVTALWISYPLRPAGGRCTQPGGGAIDRCLPGT
jgi:hypothetical protein